MATEEQVYEALRDAIATQLADLARTTPVLDADEHEGVDSQHVQLSLECRYVLSKRAGVDSLAAYRATTVPVAATASNVRELRRRVAAALLGEFVWVGDGWTTPLDRETDRGPAPNGELYSALTDWTFTV